MITSPLCLFFLFTLFIDLLERRFPKQVISVGLLIMPVVTDVTFNVLYFVSKTMIFFIKVKKNINKFIKMPSLLKRNYETKTEFFKNGERIPLENSEKHDFALFSWMEDDTSCVNKKIMYDINDINDQMAISEQSEIKFMLIEIKIGEDKTYKIDLKTNDYNFYLVGNKFTKEFFIYYLINYLNIDKTILNETTLSIKIIDHNVNIFQMEFTEKNEHFILNKMDYLPIVEK